LCPRRRAQLNKILTLANRKYNIHPRKFKVLNYNAIFLSIATYAIQIFADEYKKVRNRRKALTIQRAVLRRMYRAQSTTLVESLQIVTNTPPLELQIAIKAMKT
jgi:type II secretory pathway component PulM